MSTFRLCVPALRADRVFLGSLVCERSAYDDGFMAYRECDCESVDLNFERLFGLRSRVDEMDLYDFFSGEVDNLCCFDTENLSRLIEFIRLVRPVDSRNGKSSLKGRMGELGRARKDFLAGVSTQELWDTIYASVPSDNYIVDDYRAFLEGKVVGLVLIANEIRTRIVPSIDQGIAR